MSGMSGYQNSIELHQTSITGIISFDAGQSPITDGFINGASFNVPLGDHGLVAECTCSLPCASPPGTVPLTGADTFTIPVVVAGVPNTVTVHFREKLPFANVAADSLSPLNTADKLTVTISGAVSLAETTFNIGAYATDNKGHLKALLLKTAGGEFGVFYAACGPFIADVTAKKRAADVSVQTTGLGAGLGDGRRLAIRTCAACLASTSRSTARRAPTTRSSARQDSRSTCRSQIAAPNSTS